MKQIATLAFLLLFLQACGQTGQIQSEEKNLLSLDESFGDYWYQGKAELTSYDLEQVRYGEIREGHAVLIFVTEDFSKSKQVKLDNPEAAGDDAQKVLKLNFTKKFNTGIYPYSTMTSTFSPVYPSDDLHAVKVTTSVQEWCGHVFMQLNKAVNNYQMLLRSYFESEGDQFLELDITWLEDEIWNLIRLDPTALPEGKIRLIPSTEFIRLKHIPLKAYDAEISKSTKENLSVLSLKIPELERSLNIYYKPEHPFEIQKWDDTYPEAGKMMTTSGTLKERIMLDYWTKNSEADSVYRKDLGLSY